MSEVKVKICGITDAGDARFAIELGASMLGFNFYRQSPRYIAPAQAATILATLPPQVETVGVFVNAAVEEIASIVVASGVGAVQLHGDEDAAFCAELKQRLTPQQTTRLPVTPLTPQQTKRLPGTPVAGVRLIKALRTERNFDPADAAAYPTDAVLLDAACASFGGSGLQADWDCARAVVVRGLKVILAGGLAAENVAEAIRQVRPYAVDVCSGVESSKGRKDREKMQAFFAAVRGTATLEPSRKTSQAPAGGASSKREMANHE